jgi:hypothetical protein
MAKGTKEQEESEYIGVAVGLLLLLLIYWIWSSVGDWLSSWLEGLLGYDPMGTSLAWAIWLWPAVVLVVPPLLYWLIATLWGLYQRSGEKRRAEERAQVADALRAFRQRNLQRVIKKTLEVEVALKRAFDAELADNIATARREYPRLMKTVENEEAFLKSLGVRHPNISGFVQTRSIGDSEKSSVAKLGEFLDQLSA